MGKKITITKVDNGYIVEYQTYDALKQRPNTDVNVFDTWDKVLEYIKDKK